MEDPLAEFASAAHTTDPADLFVRLYDELPDELFTGWTVPEWYDDPEVRRQANQISEIVLVLGELDSDLVARLVRDDGHRGRFTVLLGLDIALAHANPYGPYSDSPALSHVLIRYELSGRFNGEGTTGALLPRCAFPGRPRGLPAKADYFGVHRVPEAHMERIGHRLLPKRNDAYFPRDVPVTVGCAPLLESYTDIEIKFEQRYGMSVYRLRPANHDALRARITSIIERLDASGARLAVIPEATLSDELLEHWRQTAYETARNDRETSPLRFLLVGSGPLGPDDPPPNRAVLIDRWTGEDLLVQDKMAGFTLDARQMRQWGLPGAPVEGSPAEYMTPGTTIGLLDGALGRIAIMICEDLGQSIRWERELKSCGVSHLLIPIFSKPILRFRWEQQGAERQVTEIGSWVVVSNSLAVGAAIDEKELPEPRYTCLVAGPEDIDRSSYGIEVQLGRAAAGDEPGLVVPDASIVDSGRAPRRAGADPRTPVLPTVLPGADYDGWHDHWR
ncbi:hypothetical protein [Spirillospora sp. CA-294931]|uniref:hypothetical protein n=1 Tax=Spirillospora sp. CA-294931 TaxID=3240042 RepID=UPI003D8D8BC7